MSNAGENTRQRPTGERILLVEDDEDLVNTLVYNLEGEGYEVFTTGCGKQVPALLVQHRPALVILDIMLPDMSGFEVCRSLRRSGPIRDVLVLMLTARGEEFDRLLGFESGADDYMSKPFSMRELMYRIKTLLRRARTIRTGFLSVGVLSVDAEGQPIMVENREIRLTSLEFRMLLLLLERRGRVQSREQLLSEIWGMEAEVSTRTIDTHIKYLRKKLGSAGKYIETLRGVGYRFSGDAERD